MDTNRQAQPLPCESSGDSALRQRRETDPLTTLLQEITADATERAGRYSRETLVPEGGE